MRRLVSALLLSSLLFTALPATYAQRKDKAKKIAPVTPTAQRGVETITGNQIKDYLTFISSDEMEGRDTPSRGLDTTAKFIAMNLSRWGLRPAGDNGTFLQRIDLNKNRIDQSQTRAELNGRLLTLGTDYIPLSGSGNVSGQLVFAGNGWFLKSKEWDAYKGIDPTGKIAVIAGSPFSQLRGVQRSDYGKQGEDYMNPTDYARKKGVVGIIYIPDIQFMSAWNLTRERVIEGASHVVAKFQTQANTPLPTMIASPELVTSIFAREQMTASMLFSAIAGPNPPAPFALSEAKKISLNVVSKTDVVPTNNVIGIWEGSDPVLKNEYVAVGAHYDHVGLCRPGAADPICNGADDDGSGTTAILAMAEALSKAPTRPKRSVIFVWHCGEERGLWGSRYFTENPTVPLASIVAQINIDMIGRSKPEGDTKPDNKDLSGPNDIYVIGSTMMSTELGELVDSVNKSYLNLGFDKRYDDPADPQRFFYRSDHYNYAKKGIPIVFFFDGVHEDYHRPGDTADKIDYQKMEKVTRTVYMMLWEIAQRPTRLKVDKPLPAQLASE